MAYWLVKSEPDSFRLGPAGRQRRRALDRRAQPPGQAEPRRHAKGDQAFFYHSNIGKEIVGIVEVVREAYPDPTAESGDWVCVDMKAVAPCRSPVTLAEMKADPALADMALVRYSRLSVRPGDRSRVEAHPQLGGWKRARRS